MDNETTVKALMVELLALIDNLNAMLDADKAFHCVGYETSPVLAADQNTVLIHGKQTIEITKLEQWHDRWTVLNYFKRFYAPDNAATRYVSRMPGIVVSQLPAETVVGLVQQINDTKDQIAAVVRTGSSPYMKHKFIHEAFPHIMTEQLYRHIKVVSDPVKSVWFKWVHRQVPITLTPQAAIEWLILQKDKSRGQYLPEEWQASVNAIIGEIEQGQYQRLQRRRVYKSFPVCDYSYYDAQGKRKLKSFNATLPLILVNQPKSGLPNHSDLKTFVRSEQPEQVDNLPGNAKMLFAPLSLVGYPVS